MASVIDLDRLIGLLKQASGAMPPYVSILDRNRLGVGGTPSKPALVIDFSIEDFESSVATPSDSGPKPGPRYALAKALEERPTRNRGDYWFDLQGQHVECKSLKDLLAQALRALEAARPGTLTKLSNIKLRTKRIVARDPKALFEKEHLAKEFSEPLTNGWWYGTNNSAAETRAWIERAQACAGLSQGNDMITSLTSVLQ